MPTYILDTDSFTLASRQVEPISSRLLSTPDEDLFTTAITLDETLSGWYSLVRRSTRPDQVEFAYGEMIRAVRSFCRLQILNFTQACSARYGALVRAKLNVKKND